MSSRADTFSLRIFLAYVALLAVFAGAVFVAARRGLTDAGARANEARLERACERLAEDARAVAEGRGDLAALRVRFEDVHRIDGVRLELLGPDGDLRLATGVTTSGGTTERVVTRELTRDGRAVGRVRARGDDEPLTFPPGVVVVVLVALGATVAGLYVAARSLARPLEEVERGAASLAAGDLGTRVVPGGTREVQRLAHTLNAMSDELRERLGENQRARAEVEAILASMAEGVVAVDGDERVILLNGAAARILGLDAPLATGAPLWERIRFPDLERALRAALAGRGAWSGDAPSPRADGRVLGLSVSPVGRPDEDRARRAGAVALLSDVTDVRRLEQVRIDFVANVSHELRTPLAAVMGALETLGDPESDAEVRARFLDIANRNAARLQAIVSDLLDLSSIEAEGDRMPLEPVRVDAPLRTAASALVGAAESKGVALELPAPLPAPAFVNGNAQRLEQVFTNLLENAIKYTPRGGRVTARVRVGARDVAVDVVDTGVGIPASHLPRVFERFYRVDRSRARDMGGTGLGLAIVKHVLRAHGGTVSVTSEEGQGSTFTVTLPRLADGERSRPAEPDRTLSSPRHDGPSAARDTH